MTADRQAETKPAQDDGVLSPDDMDLQLPPIEERPLVTFAVFAYNQEKYIREAVEGAFAQTYQPLEIILSDDCSTDRTFEIMQEMAVAYQGPHTVQARRNEVNVGLAEHINRIADSATGEIMTWSAGDDIADARRTIAFLNVLISKPNVNFVHSALEHIDTDGNHLCFYLHNHKIRNPDLIGSVKGEGRIVTQSCAFRRPAFELFGRLSPSVTQEAMVMGFRSCLVGGVEYIPSALTRYRIGSGISTYQGNDALRLKWLEPSKVSGWHKSSLQQMLDDISLTKIDNREAYTKLIRSELNYWLAIHQMNTNRSVRHVVTYILGGGKFGSTLSRTFLRVVSPQWLYRLTIMKCSAR